MSGTALFGIGAAANDHSGLALRSAFAKANAVVQLNAVSATTTAQPASPTDGDVYLLASTHTGTNWAGASNYQVAHYYDSAWHFYTPIEGWRAWAMDTDKLYVFDGSTWVGVLGLSANGNTQPLQPAYRAYFGSDQSDKTGDGTTFVLVGDTEPFDQGADHNPATGIFTAPVTGLYLFGAKIRFEQLASGHTTGYVDLVTTTNTYPLWHGNPYACSAGGIFMICVSQLVKMTAGDTAKFQVTVSGSAKVVDFLGTTDNRTSYWGLLVA